MNTNLETKIQYLVQGDYMVRPYHDGQKREWRTWLYADSMEEAIESKANGIRSLLEYPSTGYSGFTKLRIIKSTTHYELIGE